MKKFVSQVIVFIFILNLSVCSIAGENKIEINLQIDNPVMTVNGVEKEIVPGKGTVPIIINDRTVVPIRAIIETLGGDVEWSESTRTVKLKMNNDIILLQIDSTSAYLNSVEHILDVAPVIINSRTMLPIRFIAESFNFSVEWNDSLKRVTVIRKDIYTDIKNFSFYDIPEYSGSPYFAVNNNIPFFSVDEITTNSFESYASHDYLGRCGKCIASIGPDIMPTEDRESVSSVEPTAWQSIKYDIIEGKYLYNRCHLIGFQLTGENANDNNLITGTRYMNIEGMLPFENIVADYVAETGNHVMYRATPFFEENNLLASGVLLEGYSVEDNGEGISFCVYCYNVQPGIIINYSNGESTFSEQLYNEYEAEKNRGYYILNTNSNKIHIPSCSSVNSMKESNKAVSYNSIDELIYQGYFPCGRCNP